VSYSDEVAVFATIPVTMDFVVSGFVAYSAVMGSSLRSRMVFLFGLNTAVGTHFTVIVGFTMGVRGLFMGDNLANGVWEKVGFCFCWVCFGQGASEKRL